MPPEEEGLSWAPETGFQPEGRLVVRAPAALLAYLEPLWPRKSLNFHPFLERLGAVCFLLLCSQGSLAESRAWPTPCSSPSPASPGLLPFQLRAALLIWFLFCEVPRVLCSETDSRVGVDRDCGEEDW